MHNHTLILFDIICFVFLSVHLSDIDLTLKITASLIVIVTNIIVLYKKLKTKKK